MKNQTAFDLFQEATVDISSGNKPAAIALLNRAIAQIDRDGVDAYMRAELQSLAEAMK